MKRCLKRRLTHTQSQWDTRDVPTILERAFHELASNEKAEKHERSAQLNSSIAVNGIMGEKTRRTVGNSRISGDDHIDGAHHN